MESILQLVPSSTNIHLMSPKQSKIYLAGPMRGYDLYNFPTFEHAQADLEEQGWKVVSPAEHDLENGFDPTQTLEAQAFDLQKALAWDLAQINKVDALALLPGWQNSAGSKIEKSVAEQYGLDIYECVEPDVYAPTEYNRWHLKALEIHVDSMDISNIQTSTTGGRKQIKQCQLGAYDPVALEELGKVAGFGAQKYDAFNYLLGYPYSWSINAAYRHLLAFQAGQDTDLESGLHHCAHAMFHMGALVSFTLRNLGEDDRFV